MGLGRWDTGAEHNHILCPREACDAGDADGLQAMVEEYAAKLNALSPIALASLKKVLNSAYDSPLKTSLEVEGHSYEKLRWTHDYSEGIAAFTERRKAEFKGE